MYVAYHARMLCWVTGKPRVEEIGMLCRLFLGVIANTIIISPMFWVLSRLSGSS